MGGRHEDHVVFVAEVCMDAILQLAGGGEFNAFHFLEEGAAGDFAAVAFAHAATTNDSEQVCTNISPRVS